MSDESRHQDFSLLVTEIANYVIYLRELGVTGIEDESLLPSAEHETEARIETVARPDHLSKSVAALERNAAALKFADSKKPEIEAPRASSSSNSSSVSPLEPKNDMAKRPVQPSRAGRTTQSAAVAPPPQETLFGEITPQDEASLPRPGETLEDIWTDIGECMRCPLCCQGRTHVVNSEGNRQARIMFIGEAPGADEDAQGRPFIGRAGQLLNKIIEAIGLKREDVMIGNVNRCRPPQNRTPTPAEAKTCKPFLLREIAIIKPDVIVVLGNTAMKNLLDTKEGITKLRGQFQDYNGIKVMPTFHPAYLLRDPSKKREAWDDMKKVRDYVSGKLKLD